MDIFVFCTIIELAMDSLVHPSSERIEHKSKQKSCKRSRGQCKFMDFKTVIKKQSNASYKGNERLLEEGNPALKRKGRGMKEKRDEGGVGDIDCNTSSVGSRIIEREVRKRPRKRICW